VIDDLVLDRLVIEHVTRGAVIMGAGCASGEQQGGKNHGSQTARTRKKGVAPAGFCWVDLLHVFIRIAS
jgi:hypothetical protein